MKIVVSIALFLVVAYFLFFRNQKSGLSFWKKAQKNPILAYEYFLKSDVWCVEDGISSASQPDMSEGEWDGPFSLNVPHIGMTKIFGKVGSYEESQKEFESQYT